LPTSLSRDEFRKVTGEPDFPAPLASRVQSAQLLHYCNTVVSYAVRGVHVWMNVSWAYEAPQGGGDRHLARFRGTRSAVEVRQGEEELFRPEVYVVPGERVELWTLRAAVVRRLETIRDRYPGVGVEEANGSLRLTIPEALRTGHEAHFGE